MGFKHFFEVWLNRVMGKFGTMVTSRILFIFIIAIGVRFVISGLSAYFPAFKG